MEVAEIAPDIIFVASKDLIPPARGKFVDRIDGDVVFGDMVNPGLRHKDLNQNSELGEFVSINAGLVSKQPDGKWMIFGSSGELQTPEGEEFSRMDPVAKSELNRATAEKLNTLYGKEIFTYHKKQPQQ